MINLLLFCFIVNTLALFRSLNNDDKFSSAINTFFMVLSAYYIVRLSNG